MNLSTSVLMTLMSDNETYETIIGLLVNNENMSKSSSSPNKSRNFDIFEKKDMIRLLRNIIEAKKSELPAFESITEAESEFRKLLLQFHQGNKTESKKFEVDLKMASLIKQHQSLQDEDSHIETLKQSNNSAQQKEQQEYEELMTQIMSLQNQIAAARAIKEENDKNFKQAKDTYEAMDTENKAMIRTKEKLLEEEKRLKLLEKQTIQELKNIEEEEQSQTILESEISSTENEVKQTRSEIKKIKSEISQIKTKSEARRADVQRLLEEARKAEEKIDQYVRDTTNVTIADKISQSFSQSPIIQKNMKQESPIVTETNRVSFASSDSENSGEELIAEIQEQLSRSEDSNSIIESALEALNTKIYDSKSIIMKFNK